MRYLKQFLFLAFIAVGSSTTAQTPFTPGNIVVYRVGDGTLGTMVGTPGFNAFPVYLDEFTPTGILVRSIAMPVTGLAGSDTTKRLVMRGSSGSGFAGQLTVSANGQYLILAGFDAEVGTVNVPASVNPRSIGRIKYDGTINTTTALTSTHNGNGLTGAVSTDGNDICVTGTGTSSTGGVRYATIGATTTVQLSTAQPLTSRSLGIYDGQLYAAGHSSAPGLNKIGTGLPTTSGQTVTSLGITNAITQFVMLDMDPSIAGVDVLYATNPSTTTGGIYKYSLVGGTWTLNGTVGDPTQEYFGLAAQNNSGTVSIFATRNGTNSPSGVGNVNGGELVTLTDASGYNGAFAGTPTVLSNIFTRFGTNDMATYKGVAFVPTAPPPMKVSVKTFFQGAYSTPLSRHKDVSAGWATMMNTNATAQPFNTAPFNYAGTETVTNTFFASTAGSTDVLDWVLVELRDATTPATVIARRAAFIREDGKVVDTDGTSDVSFPGVTAGNYHVVVKHRNHLGVRTASAIAISTTATTYDFTTGQTQAYQDAAVTSNAAMKDIGGGVFVMWSGDLNNNGTTRFTGLNNDAAALLAILGGNQATVINGYNKADLNMDGVVRFTGLNNDAAYLLSLLGGNQATIITQHQ